MKQAGAGVQHEGAQWAGVIGLLRRWVEGRRKWKERRKGEVTEGLGDHAKAWRLYPGGNGAGALDRTATC